MILHEHDDARCPVCVGPIGVGLKEEAGGWKVYAVCLDEGCVDERVGIVSRATVDHEDAVRQRAEELVSLAL